MFRLIFCVFLLNLMSSVFSSTGSDSAAALSDSLMGPESFIEEPKVEILSNNARANIEDHPYIVSIRVRMFHAYGLFAMNCTGAFFSKTTYVLTAGHCVVYRLDTLNLVVHRSTVQLRFGTPFHNSGGSTGIRVEAIMIPPEYFKNGKGISTKFDFAVLRVRFLDGTAKAVQAITPVLFPDYDSTEPIIDTITRAKTQCEVVGYGITKESKRDNFLVAVNVNLLLLPTCREMVVPLNLLVEYDQVCAYTKGVDVCQGGGGALLFCPDIPTPLGIFGFGFNCGNERRPVMFSTFYRETFFLKNAMDYNGTGIRVLPKQDIQDFDENLAYDALKGANLATPFSSPRIYPLLLIMGITYLENN